MSKKSVKDDGGVLQSPPPTHEDDPLLDLSEVARRFGKSRQTVQRWCADGLMAHIRLPSGLYKVRESVVSHFLVGIAMGAKGNG